MSALEGVHRTLTPHSTDVIYIRRCANIVPVHGTNTMLEPGSGSRIENKAIIISAKQQFHTEEYGVVHESSNHAWKNTKEYGVLHGERIIKSS